MSEDTPPRQRPGFIDRIEARRAEHIQKGIFYRIVFTVAGGIVLLGGIVMLVTPGPAFLLIPIGLAMLALEFAWAERALETALEKAQVAKDKAAQASRAQRAFGMIAGVLGAAAFILALVHFDIGPF